MKIPLNDGGLDLLFRDARTYNGWLERPVSDDTLRQLYDLLRWAPTYQVKLPLQPWIRR